MIKGRITKMDISYPHIPINVIGSLEPVMMPEPSIRLGDMNVQFDASQRVQAYEMGHSGQEIVVMSLAEYEYLLSRLIVE